MPRRRSSLPTVRSCSATAKRVLICDRRSTQRHLTTPSGFRSGPVRIRPSQDQALQFPHLLSRQRRRAALVADIAQARNAVCVVAVNPVPQGLPVHAASLGRQGSWVPVQHHRQRQQPAGLLGIGRPRCRRTKPCAVQLRPRDRNRYHATHPEIDYGAYELTFTATWESHRSTSGPVGISSPPQGRTSASCSTPWSRGSTRRAPCSSRAA